MLKSDSPVKQRIARAAQEAGRLDQDIPVNHSATFAPVIQPTLDTGTQALVRNLTAPEIVGQRFATNRNMLAINSFSTPPAGVEAEVVDIILQMNVNNPADFLGRVSPVHDRMVGEESVVD